MGSAGIQGPLWGGAAEDWAAIQEGFTRPLWLDVLSAAGAGRGLRLLDAGCGAGGAAVEAARLGCHVTGVDASAELLAISRRRLPGAHFETADLEHLPFPDGAFDAAVAINTLFFAHDMERAARDLARVVRAGGRIVISGRGRPESCDMAAFGASLRPLLPDDVSAPMPGRLSTTDEIVTLIESVGLRVIARGTTRCDFHYPDRATCWRGFASAGPVRAALQNAGEDAVRALFDEFAGRHATPGGAIALRNTYVWAGGVNRRG
jgi:SAM-dependent methyltransferase